MGWSFRGYCAPWIAPPRSCAVRVSTGSRSFPRRGAVDVTINRHSRTESSQSSTWGITIQRKDQEPASSRPRHTIPAI